MLEAILLENALPIMVIAASILIACFIAVFHSFVKDSL